MGIGTRPAAVRAFWLDNDTYATMEGRELKAFKASTGEAVEYKAENRGPARGMAATRGSVVSSKGVAAYTKGQSLYINDGSETCVAELTHALLCIAGLALLWLWPGTGGIVLFALYVLLGNIPFILIQRYNRPRLQKLLRAAERRELHDNGQ